MGKKIDAEELYHRMYEEAFEKDSDLQKWDSGCWIRFKLFENVLKDMPEIKENTGHWIKYNDEGLWKCSECGQIIYSETEHDRKEAHSYCNWCGAKMEGENNERG